MVRLAFYSHDTFGLGHIRRCLKLITGIRRSIDDIRGILITGSPWAQLFHCPQDFEFVRLPPILKCGAEYRPQDEGVTLTDMLDRRSRHIDESLRAFAPDLLVVDNVPCGLRGEILQALRHLRAETETRCVLALRDVLDSHERVAREWMEVGAPEALESIYDEVWIFGDRDDAERMASLPGMDKAQILVCGHLGLDGDSPHGHRPIQRSMGETEAADRPRVLVTAGGGGDAQAIVSTYLEMLEVHPEVDSQLILGPDFPPADRQRIAAKAPAGIQIEDFVADLPQAMARCDLVVAMAGYNTVCEIEALGKRSVLVPRVWPREEQLLRARKQQRLGRACVVHPDELDAEKLWRAIQTSLDGPPPPRVAHQGAVVAARRAAHLAERSTVAELERLAS